jgi:hypothetical protein
MICILRLIFIGVFIAMVSATTWASLHQSIFAIPREVFTNPWFIATLCDAYFGFLAFYLWVVWKEPRWAARAAWFIAIMSLGNLAISVYALAELFRIRDRSELPALLSRQNSGALMLPGILVAAAIAIYACA